MIMLMLVAKFKGGPSETTAGNDFLESVKILRFGDEQTSIFEGKSTFESKSNGGLVNIKVALNADTFGTKHYPLSFEYTKAKGIDKVFLKVSIKNTGIKSNEEDFDLLEFYVSKRKYFQECFKSLWAAYKKVGIKDVFHGSSWKLSAYKNLSTNAEIYVLVDDDDFITNVKINYFLLKIEENILFINFSYGILPKKLDALLVKVIQKRKEPKAMAIF
jgi:hypothetical protein